MIDMQSPEQPSAPIDQVILDAILSGHISPGMHLGEQALASLFEVSRTSVREALIRLATRGIVKVTPRRGWFVIEPSIEEAKEVFQARCAIEIGILRTVASVNDQVIETLHSHIRHEREAIASHNAAERSYLLGDFHVCMVEALGNRVLAEILRDLTARTVLISALYQSNHQAVESCDEHQHITDALAMGNMARAADLMAAHIGHVEAGLTARAERDPLTDLRNALQITNRYAGTNLHRAA